MKKSKIIYIVGSLEIGGCEKHISKIAPKLKSRGFEITIYTISKRGALADDLEKKGIEVVTPKKIIKSKYKKAISEVYLEIANKGANEINSIIENIIKSVNINLKVVKNDFYIYDKKSRYFAETNFDSQDFSVQSAVNLFTKGLNCGILKLQIE